MQKKKIRLFVSAWLICSILLLVPHILLFRVFMTQEEFSRSSTAPLALSVAVASGLLGAAICMLLSYRRELCNLRNLRDFFESELSALECQEKVDRALTVAAIVTVGTKEKLKTLYGQGVGGSTLTNTKADFKREEAHLIASTAILENQFFDLWDRLFEIRARVFPRWHLKPRALWAYASTKQEEPSRTGTAG